MQGFFNEFAIDLLTAAGDPLQMIANANERRDPDGNALSTAGGDQGDGSAAVRTRASSMPRIGGATKGRRSKREHETSRAARTIHRRSRSRSAQSARLDQRRRPYPTIRTAAEQKEHRVIAMIKTTVIRMSRLIDNVLDFARGRLGGGITLTATTPGHSSLSSSRSSTNCVLASPGRGIQRTSRSTDRLIATATRVGQLLSNLLGNALTHGAALTSRSSFMPNAAAVRSSSGSPTPASLFRKRRWRSCSSRSFVARPAQAGKDSDWGYTSHPRSRRRMAAL